MTLRQVPTTVDDVRLSTLDVVSGRGTLVAVEGLKSVPFAIQRFFGIFDVPVGERRGEHAHRSSVQALLCIHGQCTVACDDGWNRREFTLDGPERLLYLPAMIWASQRYDAPGTVLVVLSDRAYDPDDYVRDYDAYLVLRGRPPRRDGL